MKKGTFFCIDAHTCGNPVRLVTSGHPELEGETMGEKRIHFLKEFDWIRKGLMFEPRGHDMMSGAFLYPPCSKDSDAAILFIETSGCLPMCGHGTIGAITAGLEAGLIQGKESGKLKIDVPAGQINVEYQITDKKVDWVKIFNIASYLVHQNLKINVPDLGEITLDIAYGGNFYAIIEPQKNYPGLESFSPEKILKYSPKIRDIAGKAVKCIHPEDPKVNGLSHVLWTGKPQKEGSSAANAVFYGDKAIDRSPCGTGTSARMAQLFTKGLLKQNQEFVHESIIGSQFVGCIEQVTEVSGITAIMPSIRGWAQVTGNNQIIIDDDDPYASGFQLV
ncbi:4-hydroxyproline epimerase [Pseudoalteromonas denitrificans]|uniref:Proline racemase n=1 Tax=Pseudoalteromonas denitrificans DSM 6059 TaxID=1123010 RepID=A0A1I1EIB1_9GAMM|nr:4-hydroxyproline epimerase [Pseudoalteromonas denitrificans]SFB86777.1 proline racemase [Pseudoalteromonas denitrificans DSM 6059]